MADISLRESSAQSLQSSPHWTWCLFMESLYSTSLASVRKWNWSLSTHVYSSHHLRIWQSQVSQFRDGWVITVTEPAALQWWEVKPRVCLSPCVLNLLLHSSEMPTLTARRGGEAAPPQTSARRSGPPCQPDVRSPPCLFPRIPLGLSLPGWRLFCIGPCRRRGGALL